MKAMDSFRGVFTRLGVPSKGGQKSNVDRMIFNCMNEMSGSGSLSVAFAFASAGTALGFGTMAFLAILSVVSLYLVVECSRIFQLFSHKELAVRAFGRKAGQAVEVLIFLFSFSVLIPYFILLGDFVPSALSALIGHKYHGFFISRTFIMIFLASVVIYPLTWLRGIHKLHVSSKFGIVGVTYVVLVVFIECVKNKNYEHNTVHFVSWNGWLLAAPIMSYIFTVQLNILRYHEELSPRTSAGIRKVIHFAVGGCFTLYTISGISGYLTFFKDTNGDILLNFGRGDHMATIAKLALAAQMVFAYPLICFACRKCLNRLFYSKEAYVAISGNVKIGDVSLNSTPQSTLVINDMEGGAHSHHRHHTPASDMATGSAHVRSLVDSDEADATPLTDFRMRDMTETEQDQIEDGEGSEEDDPAMFEEPARAVHGHSSYQQGGGFPTGGRAASGSVAEAAPTVISLVPRTRWIVQSTVILVTTLLVAIKVRHIELALGLIGATLGAFVNYMLPCVLYLRLVHYGVKGHHHAAPAPLFRRFRTQAFVGCWFMIGFGVCLAVSSVFKYIGEIRDRSAK